MELSKAGYIVYPVFLLNLMNRNSIDNALTEFGRNGYQ